MQPSPGRIVLYTLSTDDSIKINRRRTSGSEIAGNIAAGKWPIGAQAHIGTDVHPGQILPMIVVKTEDDRASGQVFLDGTDTLWVTFCPEDEPGVGGTWHWPPRV